MQIVAWQGDPPPEVLGTSLRTTGFACGVGRTADGETPLVVFTASPRVPAAPQSCAGWIWLCRAPLSASHRRDAVLHGAYDAMSLEDDDATSQLAARLTELLVPLPAPPADSTVAIASEAARGIIRQVARVAATS